MTALFRHRAWFSAGTALTALTLSAGAAAPPRLETHAVEAALFKNGYGYVVREAEISGPGEWIVDGPASVVHGTLWLEAEGARIDRAELVPERVVRQASSLEELLSANLGRELDVKLSGEGWTRATPVGILSEDTDQAGVSAGSSAAGYYVYPPVVSRPGPRLLILRTPDGQTILPISQLAGLRSTDGDLALEVTETLRPRRLRISVGKGRGRLRMSYVSGGLTWAPSYRLELTESGTAHLVAKANVLNDTETWDDVSVKLITGYPNLKFGKAVDPMTSAAASRAAPAPEVNSVADFLRNLSQAVGGDRTPGVAVQSMYVGPLDVDSRANLEIPELGRTLDDLFFYPVEHVASSPGGRQYLPLFEAEVAYVSIYQWDVSDLRDETRSYRLRDDEPGEDVWHMLRLTNSTSMPWTTAPVTVLREGYPVAQDVVPYTAAGADTYVKLTRAMDVRTRVHELEIARELGVAVPGRSTKYTRVTAEGTLEVVNHRREATRLVVRKTISGEVLDSEPSATVESQTTRLDALNPKNLLTWEATLAPGERRIFNYRYTVFVS